MHSLILGFDSFDPHIFETLSSQGKMPNLTRFVEGGKYARFQVSDPPQTEVSWTSIATGVDPGGHGIFDFVHRDPTTYTPFVSILPTRKTAVGVQFVPAYKARTIFEEATRIGFPATSLWWPATFPARPELPIRSIPGLGTPDILGKLGVGTLFTIENGHDLQGRKTALRSLVPGSKNRYQGTIAGPSVKKGQSTAAVSVEFLLERLEDRRARLVLPGQSIDLDLGKWSPLIELTFKMGFMVTVKTVTRVILTQLDPEVRLYFLPLQIHPLASPWRYATPPGFVKQVWKKAGPFLSLGWPQDTTGLEEGCISDDQFLDLCDAIFQGRELVLMDQLQDFREGILAVIFDDLDRVQHMFRRDRPDVVEAWYQKLDALVGRVAGFLNVRNSSGAKLLVVSDHGFASFDFKVHLNRWLAENGYLTVLSNNGAGSLRDIDWSRTRAYAIGLNSVYLNLAGREGRGVVEPSEKEALLQELKSRLSLWRGPDNRPVLQRVLLQREAFSGPLASYGPDLLLGYSPGYRASSETGLGGWNGQSIEPNHDHWSADHCIDSAAVPGVFFSSKGLEGIANPGFRDVPRYALAKDLEQDPSPPPPPSTTAGEDQEVLEDRLKSLGYL